MDQTLFQPQKYGMERVGLQDLGALLSGELGSLQAVQLLRLVHLEPDQNAHNAMVEYGRGRLSIFCY